MASKALDTTAIQEQLRQWDAASLTVTQLRMLYHLGDADGIGNADLAERLNVTRPSVSALLERLERTGFISRDVSKSDRRGITIHLTPSGRAAISNLRTSLIAKAEESAA